MGLHEDDVFARVTFSWRTGCRVGSRVGLCLSALRTQQPGLWGHKSGYVIMFILWRVYFLYDLLLLWDRKMGRKGPGRYLRSFLVAVAPSWLQITPWWATGTPFVTQIIYFGYMFCVRNSPNTVVVIHALVLGCYSRPRVRVQNSENK